MVRAPCCERMGLKRGPWTEKEDRILISYISRCGHGNWRALPKQAGLLRCGKSCRLRWTNYLRPDIKRGNFSPEEEDAIIKLHQMLGNRWSAIAAKLPGRTDNEIKNVWHTNLKKRFNPNPNKSQKRTKLSKTATAGLSSSSSSTTAATSYTTPSVVPQPTTTNNNTNNNMFNNMLNNDNNNDNNNDDYSNNNIIINNNNNNDNMINNNDDNNNNNANIDNNINNNTVRQSTDEHVGNWIFFTTSVSTTTTQSSGQVSCAGTDSSAGVTTRGNNIINSESLVSEKHAGSTLEDEYSIDCSLDQLDESFWTETLLSLEDFEAPMEDVVRPMDHEDVQFSSNEFVQYDYEMEWFHKAVAELVQIPAEL